MHICNIGMITNESTLTSRKLILLLLSFPVHNDIAAFFFE